MEDTLVRHLGMALVFATALGGVSYAQTARPATPPASTPTAPPASTRATPAPITAAPAAANEYKTEADAKRACGADPVVWANLSTKALHPTGDRYYGKTKEGAFMCQSVAVKEGMRMPRTKG